MFSRFIHIVAGIRAYVLFMAECYSLVCLVSFGHTTWLAESCFPSQGWSLSPPAVEAQSPNHWTSRGFPYQSLAGMDHVLRVCSAAGGHPGCSRLPVIVNRDAGKGRFCEPGVCVPDSAGPSLSPTLQEWFTVYERNRHTSCTVSDLIMGNEYYFRVYTENICGLSDLPGVSKNTARIVKTGLATPTHSGSVSVPHLSLGLFGFFWSVADLQCCVSFRGTTK